MKKKLAAFISAALLLAALVTGMLCGTATAFDGNDYGGGDWGGGSDWGSSDWGSSYDYGSSYSSSYDGEPLSATETILVIIMGVAIFGVGTIVRIAIKRSMKNNTINTRNVRSGSGSQGANVILPDRTAQIEQIIKTDDVNFSAGDFLSFTKNVYIDIQTAWCKRDLTPVRPVLHQNLYNTTQRQVQSKIDGKVLYHYESIAINTAYLTSYAKDSQFEYVTVYLNARMIDYQTDEVTGRILKGDKTTRWDLRYKMKFVRSVGAKTKTEVATANGHCCPNCGAPLELSSSGVCDYCGSVVTTGEYSWVLSDFTTVRNDTVDEGIKLPPSQR